MRLACQQTFRAIEHGYSLLRQTSNGLAMTVDYEGNVLAASDYFTTDQQCMVAKRPHASGSWRLNNGYCPANHRPLLVRRQC